MCVVSLIFHTFPSSGQSHVDVRYSENFSTLCVVRADLSPLASSAEPKVGKGGKTYWTIVFSVEIQFGLTEFKARIKWVDNVRAFLPRLKDITNVTSSLLGHNEVVSHLIFPVSMIKTKCFFQRSCVHHLQRTRPQSRRRRARRLPRGRGQHCLRVDYTPLSHWRPHPL